MATALLRVIETIESLRKSAGLSTGCNLNLAVTDGHSAVVSRYSTAGTTPNSLHIHTGHHYSCDACRVKLEPCREPTVLVASEALTSDESWHFIEPDHIVVVDESLNVEVRPVHVH